MNLDNYIEFIIRSSVGARNSVPIEYVEGKKSPQKNGTGFYFTNKSGDIIKHPNSYGWRMVYHPSTQRVTVGKDWKPLIPKGMQLSRELGLWKLTRLSDGMDLHFSGSRFLIKGFCTWARKEMAKNYRKRLETNRLHKQIQKSVDNTHVLLEDSRRAGNCLEGSLAFAKRLGIDRVESWFTSIPAKILLRTKNKLAENAVMQAFMRETTISI